MAITEGDARELGDLQRRYHQAQDDAHDIVDPTRREFYRKIIAIADGEGESDGTQQEIADVLGVTRPRAQQLFAQARRALG